MATSDANKMGVVPLTIITAVNMMGSGIIMLPANLAQVGTISILSWVVTAVGAALLAFAFARAGTFSNRRGGMGGYADYTFGRSGNFLANFTYFVSLLIANVAIAVTTVSYGASFLGMDLTPVAIALSTIVTLWLATVLNFGGPKITGQVSTFTVWGAIIPVLGISLIGWFFFSGARYGAAWNPHNMPFFEAVSGSVSVTLWAFLGLESACANTEAVKDPKKNVPIAVLAGTLIAAVLYIISTNVIAGIVDNDALASSNAPFGLAFATMFNEPVGKVVIALMILSCFGSLLGWQFTIAEVARSSALVGFFPKLFKKMSAHGAPIVGMVVITGIQSVLALMTMSPSLSEQFTALVNLAVVTNVMPYLLSMAAIPVLQKVEGVEPGKSRVANIVAVLATIYSLYACYAAGADAMVAGSIVTFLGWLLYGLAAVRWNGTDGEREANKAGELAELAEVAETAAADPEAVHVA